MATIGGYTVNSWLGELSQSEPAGLIYRMPGVSDPGTVYGAWQAPDYDEIITKTSSAILAAAQVVEDNYRLLAKTLVTCVDPIGRTWLQVEVFGIKTSLARDIFGSHYVIARWRLIPKALAP
jgi:hypothetical protein